MSKKKIKLRVILEPDLQRIYGEANALARLEAAKLHERYARQLRVSSKIMVADAKPVKTDPLRKLGEKRLAKN